MLILLVAALCSMSSCSATHKTITQEAVERVIEHLSSPAGQAMPERDLFIGLIAETYSAAITKELAEDETVQALELYLTLYPELDDQLIEAVQTIIMHTVHKGLQNTNRNELRKRIQLAKQQQELQRAKYASHVQKQEQKKQARAHKKTRIEQQRTAQRERAKRQREIQQGLEKARQDYVKNQQALKQQQDTQKLEQEAATKQENDRKKRNEQRQKIQDQLLKR